jgi:ATP-dependent DNA helicase RecQ
MTQDEIVFIDTEVNPTTKRVDDIGAIRTARPVCDISGRRLHTSNLRELEQFINHAVFLCGHNIINFDLKYIFPVIEAAGLRSVIDTLYLSPLLFPQKPYHKLLKDDKLQSDELNNPLNDAQKAMELFMDEVTAFHSLDPNMKKIYCTLLEMIPQFRGFFRYLEYHEKVENPAQLIKSVFHGKICENADVRGLAEASPAELAYCLATIATQDKESIIPYWVQKNYPKVQDVYRILRGVPCSAGCPYCRSAFDIHVQLKKKFGYDEFRKYDGEPLQEKAVEATVHAKSLLAVFPTGGGKSITFQLPALMAAEAVHGLTVVISPLQSLMKDQVDNLAQRGITDAVTVNGLLNTVERAEALERVENGIASILYISPESLRSKTIERLLMGRNVARFVIDEAHCFSSWGQDFRVDYLYIGDFISHLQEAKHVTIPVSCFTATAKQKVISDIREYFKQKLNIELELFTTHAARTNLRYEVLYRQNDTEKYATLRTLIEQKNCPTIVYVSRTKAAGEIAKKLSDDGFVAMPYHGKMESDEKIANQEAFIRGDVQIIVATSAFGMGVDKKDVKLVVHYDISDSLENYVQEAGRAGRDQNIQAECYVLFNENDLDKHFLLLNQTKLSISEIQQVWKGIKDLTKSRKRVCCSALEIARQAGWDDSMMDIETKVRTAICALETAGYLKRGQNCPRVYADSIQVKTAQEALDRIRQSKKFDEKQKENAVRIIRKLISGRSRAAADSAEAECRVDYIADHLGIAKQDVIESINIMREEGLLANEREMSVYVETSSLRSRTKNTVLSRYLALEGFLIEKLQEGGSRINYKVTNEEALNKGIKSSTVNNLRILLYFWIIKGYIKKPEGEISMGMQLLPENETQKLKKRYEKRAALSEFIEQFFLERAREKAEAAKDSVLINFSIQELQRAYDANPKLCEQEPVTLQEVEEALLYLSKINAFRLEGGFLVLYNAMDITRLEMDNKKRYKVEDYKQLNEFYNSKTQQIHIVGEYANMMVHDYDAALTFVNDYFQMEYKLFLTKYFKGSRLSEIDRNITPMKYQKLFENLSQRQAEIISDEKTKSIVVAAGPGSGKTKILVHKLASLMLLEDVKHEQLLMLTFSRAAAMEFKQRLVDLIGHAAYFIEIKTFHSYCFDLLGKVGNIENSKNVVSDATQMIRSADVELDRITKTVLVLDEAQDMDCNEFELVKALMERNEEMRVIAVGDDDQNIYQFRGSDSRYMASFLDMSGSRKYELVENFRSSRRVIAAANEFVKTIHNRMKDSEIQAVKEEVGEVVVTKVDSSLEMAVVRQVEATWKKGNGRTGAVLTATNEQAYLVAELLNRKGFCARLIQSNEGFSLYDLEEIRYFLAQMNEKEAPVIEDVVWERAIEGLRSEYARSENLDACINLLEQFAKVSEKKYYTDLQGFLREVRFEDFVSSNKEEILVSTIHKSKGREFDDVYMLLSGWRELNDEQKRSIYVGMTRAKSRLYICHNTKYFQNVYRNMEAVGVQWCYDRTIYPQPEEIVLPLSHRDVWLGYSGTKNEIGEIIGTLRSGDELQIREECYSGGGKLYFAVKHDGVLQKIACTSKRFYEEICRQRAKGYEPYQAKVLFVVNWKDKDSQQEYRIVLPVVRMRKK